jgi:hypothetical protein
MYCLEDYSTIITTLVSIIVIIATGWIAFRSIEKTFATNKIQFIHQEMYKHLVEQLHNNGKLIELSFYLAHKAWHHKLPGKEITETAFARFWREIGEINKSSHSFKANRELLFPSDIRDLNNDFVASFNEIWGLAKIEDQINEKLIMKHVNKMISIYNEMINAGRKYLGSDLLKKMTVEDYLKVINNEQYQQL